MKKSALASALLIPVLAVSLTGCGGGSSSPKSVTLHVFAASSLQQTFTALGKTFEQQHPGTKVDFSFGASDALATQITQGAPADVVATASTKTMDQLTGKVSDRVDFATNTMEIAVPPKNPGHITSLSDLAKPSVKLAVCQAAVPCGVVAAQVFANAHLTVKPVTEEVDVKSVLTKVTLGEVDAGVVYVSDVKTAGSSVTGITIPAADNATTTYPIAVVNDTKESALAKDFADLVTGTTGRKVLAGNGFAAP